MCVDVTPAGAPAFARVCNVRRQLMYTSATDCVACFNEPHGVCATAAAETPKQTMCVSVVALQSPRVGSGNVHV